jgi:DNA-binding HxlR family transcriptional regulator
MDGADAARLAGNLPAQRAGRRGTARLRPHAPVAGHPRLGISEGSLYPLLSRLRLQGLLAVRRIEESPDGPARKIYGLTPRGRQILALMNDRFEVMKRQHQTAKKRSAP